jgi:hypothetical protein
VALATSDETIDASLIVAVLAESEEATDAMLEISDEKIEALADALAISDEKSEALAEALAGSDEKTEAVADSVEMTATMLDDWTELANDSKLDVGTAEEMKLVSIAELEIADDEKLGTGQTMGSYATSGP